jgi:hypothetical protein
VTIDLGLAKAQVRVTHDSENALIGSYIAAAQAWVERYTGLTLTEEDTPPELDQTMLLLVGHWYQNREAAVVGTISGDLAMAVKELAGPFRTPTLK